MSIQSNHNLKNDRQNQKRRGNDFTAPYYPNATRINEEDKPDAKEDFSDTFMSYLLNPSILEGSSREEFFSQNMNDWLCALLGEIQSASGVR